MAECEEAGESEHLARLLHEYLAPEEDSGADESRRISDVQHVSDLSCLLLLSFLAALPAAASWEVNGNATS